MGSGRRPSCCNVDCDGCYVVGAPTDYGRRFAWAGGRPFPVLNQSDNTLFTWLYSAVFLLFSVWALSYGERHDDKFIINISFIWFGAEVLYIYFKTFGTLLHQSAFFAVGGVLLIALSILLERLRRRIVDDTAQQAVAS